MIFVRGINAVSRNRENPNAPKHRDYIIPMIDDFIFNRPLAEDILASITAGLASPAFHHIAGGSSEWQEFKRSYDQAVRDIVCHPRGELFKRLIEYGSSADQV